jgi:hypothetical protein
MKNYVGKALALQHVFMHLAVALGVTSLTTPGIHNDLSRDLPRSWIELQRAFFQLKGPVHAVQRSAQVRLCSGLRRIKLKIEILGGS